MADSLVIVGASVRAAAGSALRAGLAPVGVDLFADRDLVASCPASRVEADDYPDGLARLAAEAPPGPWMYTGALENHPDLIDRIAAGRPLWGNPGAVVRRARDPAAVVAALRAAGLPALDVRPDPAGLPEDGSWLIKPVRSAGGAGIRPWLGRDEGERRFRREIYAQRRARGPSGSAVFVADRGGARLKGLTRQWVGRGDEPFGYVGSLAPLLVPAGVREQIERTGSALAGAFGLLGLFGVDFVLDGGVAWPTEVNPRYSASVEVLEYATGHALLRDHVQAFGGNVAGNAVCNSPIPACVCKVILFADRDGTIPRSLRWPRVEPRSSAPPRLADLPEPGSAFRAGQPVLTLLESGPDERTCRRRLAARRAAWRRSLRSWSTVQGVENQTGRPSY